MLREKILKRPLLSTVVIFLICLAVHVFETLVIRLDQTSLGENFLSKVFGIGLLYFLLRQLFWTWEEIGFDLDEMGEGIKKGLKIAVLCFTFAYCFEMLYLSAKGGQPRFMLYAGSFSLSGDAVRMSGFTALLLCVLFNIINVWMEEGMFRGLFINLLSGERKFLTAGLISAVLFGIWHFPLPVRNWIDGEWGLSQTLLMCLGYFILSALMGVKWAMMREMDGNIWQGLADHLFNNLVVTNLLHVVTNTGADEWIAARVAIGQILSFLMILILYRKKDDPEAMKEKPRRFRRPPLITQAEKASIEAQKKKPAKKRKK